MDPGADHLLLATLFVLSAFAFWYRERVAARPFIDTSILTTNRPLLATYIRNLLSGTVMYSFLYGFSQWLEEGHQIQPVEVGLMLLPLSLFAIIAAAISGRSAEVRHKLLIASGAQILGCITLFFTTPESPIWLLVVIIIIMGIPQGLAGLANQNAVYYQADTARIASSAGLLRTFSYLGAIVSASLTGTFYASGANTAGLHDLAIVLAAASIGSLVLALVDGSIVGIGRKTTRTQPS